MFPGGKNHSFKHADISVNDAQDVAWYKMGVEGGGNVDGQEYNQKTMPCGGCFNQSEQ